MSYDINLKDEELLKTDPQQLIINHQSLIDTIIFRFVRSGCFRYDERNDVKQHINEQLLKRLPKIQHQFQGMASVKTYLSVVIRNICNEILRKGPKAEHIPYEGTVTAETHNEAIYALIFEEEMARLNKIMELFFGRKPKIMLCLKLAFRMPFGFDDFQHVYENMSHDDFRAFSEKVLPYPGCTDAVVFSALTGIFNTYEHKNNTPDASRKWTKQKIDDIIGLLNGDPPRAKYTEETFQILFEKCFFNEMQIDEGNVPIIKK